MKNIRFPVWALPYVALAFIVYSATSLVAWVDTGQACRDLMTYGAKSCPPLIR